MSANPWALTALGQVACTTLHLEWRGALCVVEAAAHLQLGRGEPARAGARAHLQRELGHRQPARAVHGGAEAAAQVRHAHRLRRGPVVDALELVVRQRGDVEGGEVVDVDPAHPLLAAAERAACAARMPLAAA